MNREQREQQVRRILSHVYGTAAENERSDNGHPNHKLEDVIVDGALAQIMKLFHG